MHARGRALRRTLLSAMVIGLALLGSSSARAEDAPDDAAARFRAEREKLAGATQQFLAELSLTRAQARRLLPIAEKAADQYVELYDRQAQLLPEMAEAYGAFAEEDRLNQGFTREVERRTARAHQREIRLRDEHARKLIALEQEALKVLYPAQRARAESFRPGQRRPLRKLNPNSRAGRRRARRLAERQQLVATRQQLRDMHLHRHPRTGNLGRHLLQPPAFAPLCQIAGQPPSKTLQQALRVFQRGTHGYPSKLYEEQRTQVADLRRDINNWNLINGLHLNQRQIERIIALYESAAPGTQRRRSKAARPSGQMLLALERSVEEVLNPGQLEVLSKYKPCLLPPKNLKDPVRIGQSSDNSHIEKWLTRTRRLPRNQLNKAINQAIEREENHYGKLKPAERRKRRTLLLKTLREAARMSDTEFELSRAELAARITPPDRQQELQDQIADRSRRLGDPGRIAHMMLKPDFIQQLRQRGQQFAAGGNAQSADLTAEPQAENCERGCAIDPKKPGQPSLEKPTRKKRTDR